MIALLVASILAAPGTVQDPARAQPPVRLQGTVVDAMGSPLPAAEVWLSPAYEPWTVLARGRTDGEGLYRLSTTWAKPIKVHARFPGKVQGHAWVPGQSPSPAALPAIRLWDAVTLRGRVTNADGSPVAHAVIATGPVRSMSVAIDPVEARSGADGRYELPHAPMGEVWLSAWAPGRATVSRQAMVAPGPDQDFTFGTDAPRGFRLSIQGLPEGVSAAGWSVQLTHAHGPERVLPRVLHRGHLDEDGSWQVAGLPTDQGYHVSVTDPDRQWFCKPAVWSKRKQAERIDLAAHRAEPVTWKVTLVGPDNTGLAGQRLKLWLASSPLLAPTAQDGTASITALCGPYRGCGASLVGSTRWVLSARARHDDEDGPLYSSGKSDPTTLRAVPAASLSGQLVDEQGEAIAFCDVALEEWGQYRLPKWFPVARARSDENGRFRMDGMFPYERLLQLRIPKTRTLWPVDAALASGEVLDVGRVTATAAGTIEGVVRGASGAPIPGARVFLIQIGPPGKDQTELLTDAGGRFRFAPAAPGTWMAKLYWSDSREMESPEDVFEVGPGATVVRKLRSSRH